MSLILPLPLDDLTESAYEHRQRHCARVHLAKLDGIEVVDLLRTEYPAPFRISRNAMLRRPARCTALGKALLAYSEPRVVADVVAAGLPRLTRYTITGAERFQAKLERIRRRGYAVDNEEFYAGRRCLAAPVFDEQRRAVAAISISGMITEVKEDRVPVFARSVMASASQISEHLGHRSEQPAANGRM